MTRKKTEGQREPSALAVARKLVTYLLAVDRRQKEFLVEKTAPPRSTVPRISGGFL